MMGRSVHVVTNMPSYHQVDLFDRLADLCRISVTYLRPITPGRLWSRMPRPRHPHRILPVTRELGGFYWNRDIRRTPGEIHADLLVVTQYAALSFQWAMYRAMADGMPWVFWSEKPGVKYFEVENPLPEWARPAVRRIAMLPLRRARRLWAVGRVAAKEYHRLFGPAVRVMPYYSDLSAFRRRGVRFGPDRKVRFLFAGRFSFRKGFDTVCEAFDRLAGVERLRGQWTLTVCGDGPLRSKISRFPWLSRSLVDVGFRELEEMPQIMGQHEVLVAPSRYDGWGMVVPEAMAAGMVIIATRDVGAAMDVGEDHDWLRFVEAGDSASLFGELCALIERRDDIPNLGKAAEEHSRAYDVSNGAARFVELVEEALSG